MFDVDNELLSPQQELMADSSSNHSFCVITLWQLSSVISRETAPQMLFKVFYSNPCGSLFSRSPCHSSIKYPINLTDKLTHAHTRLGELAVN